jgi:hypothetical protein
MKARRFAEGDIVRIEREGPDYGKVGIVKEVLKPEGSDLTWDYTWDYALALDETGQTYGFYDEELDPFG